MKRFRATGQAGPVPHAAVDPPLPGGMEAPPLDVLLRASPVVLYALRVDGLSFPPVYVSPSIRERMGYAPEDCLRDIHWWSDRLHPEDRERVIADLPRVLDNGHWVHEYRFRAADGGYRWVRDVLTLLYDGEGHLKWVAGAWLDITEAKRADESHLALLTTLRRADDLILGRMSGQGVVVSDLNTSGEAVAPGYRSVEADHLPVDGAIGARARDLDALLTELLDLTLDLFGADRAWLLHPCDPEGPWWEVPIERTRTGWPGAFSRGERISMTADMAATFREILAVNGPVTYGPGGSHPVPKLVAEQFQVQSRMAMAVRPAGGPPWLFGVHWCSAVHGFDGEQLERFKALGERLGDALCNALLLRRLHDGERRYRHLFEQAPISLWEEDASAVKALIDGLRADGVKDLRAYLDAHPEQVLECARRVRVLNVNRATLELYAAGTKHELLGQLDKTFNANSLRAFKEEVLALAEGRTRYAAEAQTCTLDRELREVMVSMALAPGHEHDWSRVLVVISDITERKQTEQRIGELNRTLRLISECNQTLVRAVSIDELLEAVCRQIAEVGGYRFAWVGLVDMTGGDKRVRPVARAGIGGDYLDHVRITWGDDAHGRGPTGTAIRQAESIVCRDIHNDPRFAPWREQAEARGYASSASLPLRESGRVVGALNIYAEQADAFPDEELRLLEGLADDISYGLRVLHERLDRERTHQHLFAMYDASPDMIFIYSPEGELLDVNDNAVRGVGFPDRESMLVADLAAYVGSAGYSPDEALRRIRQAGQGEPQDIEWAARRADGTEIPLEVRLRRLDEGGRVLVVARDISERKAMEARLAQQAYYDELTCLPNRRLALDRLGHGLAAARREGVDSALMLLDLDNFKHINDSYGHPVGDRLLVEVARRLQQEVRTTDTVARLGGDEFLVLMNDIPHEDEVLNLADKILRVFKRPVSLDGRDLVVSTSIGIARFPADGADPDALLQAADSAMYQAKGEGRNTYCFFSREINRRMERYLELGAALHHALDRGELQVQYQPVVSPDGSPAGVEALLRWQHSQWGWVSPAEFIPVAEDRGLIVPIGRWVLHQACMQMQRWRSRGLPLQWVSVNLSPRQFWEQDLQQQVADALADSGLPGECLKLELTESLLLDHPPVLTALEALRAKGVHLALDDFGTGYSSLSYLKRYPFDTLKIDRSFVHDLEHDPDDLNLTRTIIAMARVLGLQVIAEGVETGACARLLVQEGCDLLQGFLFSEALAAADLEAWLLRPRRGGQEKAHTKARSAQRES